MKAKHFRNVAVGSIRGWVACALVGALGAVKPASAEPAPLYARMQPVAVDSGRLDNPRNEPAVVFSQVIDLGPDVPWLRVLFDKETALAPGSYIRVTSLLDGETQILDAEQLKNWDYGTAFFNGSQITIELIAARNASGDAVRVSQLFVGDIHPTIDTGGVATICGDDDNRKPFPNSRDSQAMGIGRLLSTVVQQEGKNTVSPLGICTAFIIAKSPAGEPDERLHLTAGHCFGNVDRRKNQLLSVPYILQFNVYCDHLPPQQGDTCSNPDCTIKHPPVADQFRVDENSVISFWLGYDSSPPGDDYAVFRCKRNSLGQTTWARQGTLPDWAFTLATAIPPVGTTGVRVTGYGVDGNEDDTGGGNVACTTCNPNKGRRNATLQTAPTPPPNQPPVNDPPTLRYYQGTVIGYDVDMCGANSGSPVFRRSTGEVIGINTDHGCNSDTPESGLNYGTAITHGGLQGAIAFLENTPIPAVSTWGLVVLALMTATGGTLILRRRVPTRG